MLNARLYRVALIPFVLALAICAFSLGARPAPLQSSLATDAFDGQRAYADMEALAHAYPQRRPGSPGDAALAGALARQIEGLGTAAGGGFAVHAQSAEGETAEGSRQLVDVVAVRPGSTAASPIVIVAHRDAASSPATAELSGTAVLLELARVFAARETKRTIVLVSTSGGSGGAAGAQAALAGPPLAGRGPLDAAIVLGDEVAPKLRSPLVVPYSDGYGSAPLQLQRTVAAAIRRVAGINPGEPSTLGQLAHMVFPLAVGEQGVLLREGLPSVLVQASGERGPSAHEGQSPERLEALGRSVLSTVDALDAAPDVAAAPQTALVVEGKTLPAWAVRLLALTLLLAPAVAALDALARARRRRAPIGAAVLWTLSCALPFLACALFAYVLGALGVIDAPAVPPQPAASPFDGGAATVVAAVGLTFVLAWLLWAGLVRRLGARRPDAEVGGLAVVLVLVPLALVVWIANPYAALLLVPAANLLLALTAAELRPGRALSLALVACALVPLALLLAFYADQLGLGPGAAAWFAVLTVAGGHVGLGGALVWSVAAGAAVAAVRIAASRPRPPALGETPLGDGPITIRGPLTYAGPGSLGGTQSALRR